jgi:hypothetical protein
MPFIHIHADRHKQPASTIPRRATTGAAVTLSNPRAAITLNAIVKGGKTKADAAAAIGADCSTNTNEFFYGLGPS